MKKTWIIVLILFLVAFSACETGQESENNSCLEVELIEELCGNAVLRVINPKSTKLKLQDWTDGNGIAHTNVFSTMFPCNVDQSTIVKGKQFYIEIVEEPEVGECMRCMAILANAPEITYHIKIVETCN
jgi:hypothetical protein